MNTKISDAAVEAALAAWRSSEGEGARDLVRDALAAALSHLAADAVPVAYIEHFADRVSHMKMTVEGLALGIGRHELYPHPQPAALDEVGVAAGNNFRIALERISSLDPDKDSDEGYNEWGEADCFRQARRIAIGALEIK